MSVSNTATSALARLARILGVRQHNALILLLAGPIALGGGITLLEVRHARAREAAQHELSAIADQRERRLIDWRQERLADGKYFSSARFAAEGVQRWLVDPESAIARAGVIDWLGALQGENRYYEVMVLDRHLGRRLALPPEAGELTATERAKLAEVLQTGEVVLADLEREPTSGRVYCEVLFPIFDPADRKLPPFAIGLLRANARASLFPVLQQWPIPSATAETLLVRREGEDVLYLNDLRHRANTALSLRQSMSNSHLPAARILRGETAPFEGIDYRGVPVVAVGRLIPGTPWALVAKVDRQEIYSGVRGQLLAESAVLGSVLLGSAMAVAFLWQNRRSTLLRSAAAEWERTFDSVPDLIAILDKQKRIVRVNRAMAERIGRTQADCAGTSCFECVHVTARPPGDCPQLRTLEDLQTHSIEMFDPRLGGDFHITTAPLFDERGELTGTVHVARDITERKQAEAALRESRQAALNLMADAVEARQEAEKATAALRESEADFRGFFENVGTGTAQIDANGRFKRVNDRFCEIAGCRREELLGGMGPLDLDHPEEREADRARLERFFSGKDPLYASEKRYLRKDGSVVWVRVQAKFIHDDFGQRRYTAAIVEDITKSKLAEEALKASLREKEVMLKEIHHRVKNNLQVLTSLVNLQARSLSLERERGTGDRGQDTPDNGRRTNDHPVLAAFDDLRDRVRSMAMVHEKLYQSESLAAVDFAEYAKSLLSYLVNAHRTTAAIQLKLELDPLSLSVDRAVPCGLILNELASNALKHAFPGRAEGRVTVSSRTRDGHLSLSVSDDGVGLPSELDWRQAPSLGLQLVQMLSRQLDASVEVRRSDGGGTEFELRFEVGHP